jgi:crotonobetainyl-CoA:carnitine CoA-transferase CaiB-like acyl-CoA transferase
MALYWKRVSGEGQQVDISIQQSVESSAPNSQILFQVTGESFQQLNGSYAVLPARVDTTPPIWEVKDGYVAYTVFTGETGARMNAPVIQWMTEDGMADDFLKNLDWNKFEWIGASRDDIDSIAQQHIQFFKTKTMKQLVEEGVKQRGAAIQPMYTIREVVEHPQLQARHYWQELEHPELGASIEYPGGFCKPSTTSCGLHRRAPLIGEHNQEIYHDELGLSLEQIDSLKQKGVI